MNNSGTHLETLRPPLEEGDHSSVADVVKYLFSHELSGANWRKYKKTDLLKLIDEKVQNSRIEKSNLHYILLMKCLKRPSKMEDCLFALTSFLLGKGL
jgi:hypothetical protein